MKDLIIIKLGGSVVTNKGRVRGAFRRVVVERLAKEIVEARRKKDFNLILVHGAGSFGHPIAKKYNLHKGYLGEKSSRGFVLTKKAMFDLSMLVWKSLLEAGVDSCVVEPSAIIFAERGEIKNFSTEFVENLLGKKIIPILFGDAVFDGKMGISIISGDLMVSYLAKKLKANKVIFVSDVDGVFDKNPKVFGDAELHGEVNKKNYAKVVKDMEIFNKNDISGEMGGKIMAIKKDLAGISVELVNGYKAGRLRLSILGRSVVGTRFGF